MARNYGYKANLTLGLATVGFLLAYPFHAGFWGGLASGGFSAAMIGGLADWFAVTALFRRPLGVRPGRFIRTEIIPRNRERIFAALISMVQDELLTKDNLKKQLANYNIAELLLRYWEENGGKQEVSNFLKAVGEDLINKVDAQAAGKFGEDVIKAGMVRIRLSPLAAKLIGYFSEHGYDEKLVEFAAEELKKLVRHRQFNSLLIQLVREAIQTYEKDMDRRKFANSYLLNISPLKLTEEIQATLLAMLANVIENKLHPIRRLFKQKLAETADRLERDEILQGRLEGWLEGLIKTRLNLTEEIGRQITDALALNRSTLWGLATEQTDKLAARLKLDHDLQVTLDCFVKDLLLKWLDIKHGELGNLVKEKLDSLGNDMLVELIEAKAGNDLQIIRINGSVVGGLAGVGIYLVTYFLV